MIDPGLLETLEGFERAIKDMHWQEHFDSDSRSTVHK